MKKSKKGTYILYAIIGILFCFFQITGKLLARDGNLVWTGGETTKILGLSLVAGTALGLTLCFLLFRADGKKKTGSLRQSFGYPEPKKMRRWTALSFLLIVLCRVPAYLAYYPGILSFDTGVQLEQIRNGVLNDHHPLIHTLMLKAALYLGVKNGNVNGAFAVLTVLQVLFLSFAMAWTVRFFLHKRASKTAVVLAQLFFMFYPFHRYMSLACCKDVFFTGFFMLTITEADRFLEKRTWKTGIVSLLCALFMQLFRNNGRYVLLFSCFIAFLVLILTKKEKKAAKENAAAVALWSLSALVLGVLVSTGLFRITGAEQGDKREMLSVPIQQLARTMLYHEDPVQQAAEKEGRLSPYAEIYYKDPNLRTLYADSVVPDGTMEQRDMDLIRDFLLYNGYLEYRPEFADPVKGCANTYVARYRSAEFAGTYLRLMRQYLGDFINAGLALDAGYLYMDDTSHATVNLLTEDELGHGYALTSYDEAVLEQYGIRQDSKWPSLKNTFDRWAGENRQLNVPILKYLFVPATLTYAYLLLFAGFVRKKNQKGRLLLLLPAGLLITMLLGPVVALRYVYPLICCFPVCLMTGQGGTE